MTPDENCDALEAAGRLKALLAAPHLTLTAEGGGLPDRGQLVFDGALVIDRVLAERILALLAESALAEHERQFFAAGGVVVPAEAPPGG